MNIENRLSHACDIASSEKNISSVASYIDGLWNKAHVEGNGPEFLDQLNIWADRLDNYSIFGRSRLTSISMPQPSLKEAIFETSKRLIFLEQFSRDLPGSVIAEIIGGSMSYGRFYNIRGGDKPSDIDIFFIVDDTFFDSSADASLIMHGDKGFSGDESNGLVRRISNFKDLYTQERADMFYHKFFHQGFPLSLKIIPERKFIWEFIDVPNQLMAERKDREVSIRVYKGTSIPWSESVQTDFFNDRYQTDITAQPLSNGESIANLPVSIFENGKFYTGDHQSSFMPCFDIAYQRDTRAATIIQSFLHLLRKEFDVESQYASPGVAIDYVHILTRRNILSPYVVARAKRAFSNL